MKKHSELRQWVRLHLQSLDDLHRRWIPSPDALDDPLLGDDRREQKAEHHWVWTVKSELELVRLVGALQWQNKDFTLWYRGENKFHPSALPSRFRDKPEDDRTAAAITWMCKNAWRDRALRDREPAERIAILQHYGCHTSLLDLTANLESACAFACDTREGETHLRVYALPRHTRAVTVSEETDTVLVDLRAALPSYFARPHVQSAAFLARRAAAVSDMEGHTRVDPGDGLLDDLCIGHIRLAFDGHSRFYLPRLRAGTLYPMPSKGCRLCSTTNHDGDFGLHYLRCLAKSAPDGAPPNFPDAYAESTEQRRIAGG